MTSPPGTREHQKFTHRHHPPPGSGIPKLTSYQSASPSRRHAQNSNSTSAYHFTLKPQNKLNFPSKTSSSSQIQQPQIHPSLNRIDPSRSSRLTHFNSSSFNNSSTFQENLNGAPNSPIISPATPPKPRIWNDENAFDAFQVEDSRRDLDLMITCNDDQDSQDEHSGITNQSNSHDHHQDSNTRKPKISMGHVEIVMSQLKNSTLTMAQKGWNRIQVRCSTDDLSNVTVEEIEQPDHKPIINQDILSREHRRPFIQSNLRDPSGRDSPQPSVPMDRKSIESILEIQDPKSDGQVGIQSTGHGHSEPESRFESPLASHSRTRMAGYDDDDGDSKKHVQSEHQSLPQPHHEDPLIKFSSPLASSTHTPSLSPNPSSEHLGPGGFIRQSEEYQPEDLENDPSRESLEDEYSRDSDCATSQNLIDEAHRESVLDTCRQSDEEDAIKLEYEPPRESEEEGSSASEDEAFSGSEDDAARKTEDEPAIKSEDENCRELDYKPLRESAVQASGESEDEASRDSEDDASRESENQPSRESEDEAARESEAEASRRSEDDASRDSEDETSRIDEPTRESEEFEKDPYTNSQSLTNKQDRKNYNRMLAHQSSSEEHEHREQHKSVDENDASTNPKFTSGKSCQKNPYILTNQHGGNRHEQLEESQSDPQAESEKEITMYNHKAECIQGHQVDNEEEELANSDGPSDQAHVLSYGMNVDYPISITSSASPFDHESQSQSPDDCRSQQSLISESQGINLNHSIDLNDITLFKSKVTLKHLTSTPRGFLQHPSPFPGMIPTKPPQVTPSQLFSSRSPIVEIASVDPKVAARAAAILKVHHGFIPRGFKVENSDLIDDDQLEREMESSIRKEEADLSLRLQHSSALLSMAPENLLRTVQTKRIIPRHSSDHDHREYYSFKSASNIHHLSNETDTENLQPSTFDHQSSFQSQLSPSSSSTTTIQQESSRKKRAKNVETKSRTTTQQSSSKTSNDKTRHQDFKRSLKEELRRVNYQARFDSWNQSDWKILEFCLKKTEREQLELLRGRVEDCTAFVVKPEDVVWKLLDALQLDRSDCKLEWGWTKMIHRVIALQKQRSIEGGSSSRRSRRGASSNGSSSCHADETNPQTTDPSSSSSAQAAASESVTVNEANPVGKSVDAGRVKVYPSLEPIQRLFSKFRSSAPTSVEHDGHPSDQRSQVQSSEASTATTTTTTMAGRAGRIPKPPPISARFREESAQRIRAYWRLRAQSRRRVGHGKIWRVIAGLEDQIARHSALLLPPSSLDAPPPRKRPRQRSSSADHLDPSLDHLQPSGLYHPSFVNDSYSENHPNTPRRPLKKHHKS